MFPSNVVGAPDRCTDMAVPGNRLVQSLVFRLVVASWRPDSVTAQLVLRCSLLDSWVVAFPYECCRPALSWRSCCFANVVEMVDDLNCHRHHLHFLHRLQNQLRLDDGSVATPVSCRTDRSAFANSAAHRSSSCRCISAICHRNRILDVRTHEVLDQD